MSKTKSYNDNILKLKVIQESRTDFIFVLPNEFEHPNDAKYIIFSFYEGDINEKH